MKKILTLFLLSAFELNAANIPVNKDSVSNQVVNGAVLISNPAVSGSPPTKIIAPAGSTFVAQGTSITAGTTPPLASNSAMSYSDLLSNLFFFNTNPVSITGTTASSTTISSMSSTAGIVPGMAVKGAGIGAYDYVISVNTGASTCVISSSATASASGVALTFQNTGYVNLGVPGDYLIGSASIVGNSGTQQASGIWTVGGYWLGAHPLLTAGTVTAGDIWYSIEAGTNDLTGVTTACTTHSTTSVTVTGSTTGIVNGMQVSGAGITPGTTCTISGSTVTLSETATASGSGVQLNFFYTASVVEAGLLAVYTQAQTDGAKVLAHTIMTSGGIAGDADTARKTVNTWIRSATASAHYNYLDDLDNRFPNYHDANWRIAASTTGTHPNAIGNIMIAEYEDQLLANNSFRALGERGVNSTDSPSPILATGHQQPGGYYDFYGPWQSYAEQQINVYNDGTSSSSGVSLDNYIDHFVLATPTGPSGAMEPNWDIHDASSGGGGGSNNFDIQRYSPTTGSYVDNSFSILSSNGLGEFFDGLTVNGTTTLGSGVISLGGNFTTSGAYNTTFTMTAGTSVTFPTSGTLLTTTGSGSGLSGVAILASGNAFSGGVDTFTYSTGPAAQFLGSSDNDIQFGGTGVLTTQYRLGRDSSSGLAVLQSNQSTYEGFWVKDHAGNPLLEVAQGGGSSDESVKILYGATVTGVLLNGNAAPGHADGTNSTATVTGNSGAGTLQVVVATGATSGVITTLTLGNSTGFPTKAIMTLTPANAATANLVIADDPYVTGTATTCVLNSGGTGMPVGTYLWNYHISGY